MIRDLSELSPVRDYLNRVGATARGLRTAAIGERVGRYWRVLATIHLDNAGEISVRTTDGEDPAAYEPTDSERALIKAAAAGARWPEHVAPLGQGPNLTSALREAEKAGQLFEFRDNEGRLLMLQMRVEKADGNKTYLPFTYWTDGEWRQLEPEGLLPLWGQDQLKHFTNAFVHEGAKAARAVRRMVESATPEAKAALVAHPWGAELSYAAHLGWIGGALNPHRTDWAVLAKAGVTHVTIVADNDAAGRAAVPQIARALAGFSITVSVVRFDEQWSRGFDLADPFPTRLFKIDEKGNRSFVGPAMQACTLPATWATRLGNPPATRARGRPALPPVFLRPEFAAQWWMVVGESGTLFAPQHDPTRLYNPEQFDTLNRAFSHIRRLSDTFKVQAYDSIAHAIAYEPGLPPGIVNVEGVLSLNTHVPARVRRWKDDSGIWDAYLQHLFPEADDRQHLSRWFATLIARPGVRMSFGLLLASTAQGVGKTTLCEIARVLVGERNSSAPSASQVVKSDFNGWIVRKRFVFINEIYEGQSWAAYNRLKSYITDTTLMANEKFVPNYTVRNWAHFILCSNSELALRIDQNDRRFLVPRVTEQKHPPNDPQFWVRFHEWLACGGYGAIAHWADEFVAKEGAVRAGEAAPMSERKQQLIEDSRSAEERLTRDLAAAATARSVSAGQPVVLVEEDVIRWIRSAASERKAGSEIPPLVIRGWLRSAGLHVLGDRPKVGGKRQHVFATTHLGGDGWPAWAIYRVQPNDIADL